MVLIRVLNGSNLVLGVRKITQSSLGAGGSSSRSRYLVVVEHCCTQKIYKSELSLWSLSADAASCLTSNNTLQSASKST